MRKVKKTNQLKDNVLAARCHEQFKKDVTKKYKRDGVVSESEMLIALCKAYLQGELVYRDYRFVAKEK